MSWLSCGGQGKTTVTDFLMPKRHASVWIGELAAMARTGDVVLFSSKNSGSYINKFFTHSEFDHVGIIVKPSPKLTYIIEWGGGLFACELEERLTEYAELDGMMVRACAGRNGGSSGDSTRPEPEPPS